MIMWEFVSGIPPFNNRAHDHQFSLSICKGERPVIIENTPKCYANLMEKCWNSEPSKRPTVKILENIISEWLDSFNKYDLTRRVKLIYDSNVNDSEMIGILEEFEKASAQKQVNASITHSHPQSYYKSRLLEKVNETLDQDDARLVICSNSANCTNLKSECLDCEINYNNN